MIQRGNKKIYIPVYCSTVDILLLYLKCIMQSCFPPENVYCSALSHRITIALITNCKNTTSSTIVISRRLKKNESLHFRKLMTNTNNIEITKTTDILPLVLNEPQVYWVYKETITGRDRSSSEALRSHTALRTVLPKYIFGTSRSQDMCICS